MAETPSPEPTKKTIPVPFWDGSRSTDDTIQLFAVQILSILTKAVERTTGRNATSTGDAPAADVADARQ